MRPSWHGKWRALAFVSDAVFVTAAMCGIAVARFGVGAIRDGFVPAPGRAFARAPLLLAIPLWLLASAMVRLYTPTRCQNALEEGRRIILAALASSFGLVMLGFLYKDNVARSFLFLSALGGVTAVAVGRSTLRRFVARLRSKGRWMTRTVIVGRTQAKAVWDQIKRDPGTGLQVVATCGFTVQDGEAVGIEDVRAAVGREAAEQILIVTEDLERTEVARVIEVADELPVRIVIIPGLDYLLLGSLQLVTIANEPGMALEPPSTHGYQAAMKRIFDVVIATVALVVSLPLMIVTLVLIRLDSPGSPLLRLPRQGRDGRTFGQWKFRTMHDGAPQPDEPTDPDVGFYVKTEDDERITRVGGFLRRTSIDELPQLINVLSGDMSLVGPRPLACWEAERLKLNRRIIVRPGITGLWQVSGRSDLSAAERIRLDLVYIQNWSLLLDASILLRTVPALISRRGAY